jgi:hypothetical protein
MNREKKLDSKIFLEKLKMFGNRAPQNKYVINLNKSL